MVLPGFLQHGLWQLPKAATNDDHDDDDDDEALLQSTASLTSPTTTTTTETCRAVDPARDPSSPFTRPMTMVTTTMTISKQKLISPLPLPPQQRRRRRKQTKKKKIPQGGEVVVDLQDYHTAVELYHFLHHHHHHDDDDDDDDDEKKKNDQDEGTADDDDDDGLWTATTVRSLLDIDKTTKRIVGLHTRKFFPRQLTMAAAATTTAAATGASTHCSRRRQQQQQQQRLQLTNLDLGHCHSWTSSSSSSASGGWIHKVLFERFIDPTTLYAMTWNVSMALQLVLQDREQVPRPLEVKDDKDDDDLQDQNTKVAFDNCHTLRLVGSYSNTTTTTTTSSSSSSDAVCASMSFVLSCWRFQNLVRLETQLSNLLYLPDMVWLENGGWGNSLRHLLLVVQSIDDTDFLGDDECNNRSSYYSSSSCSSGSEDDGFGYTNIDDDDEEESSSRACRMLLQSALQDQVEVRAYKVLASRFTQLESLEIQLQTTSTVASEDDDDGDSDQQHENRDRRRDRRRSRRRDRHRRRRYRYRPTRQHRHVVPISLLTAGHLASSLKSLAIRGSGTNSHRHCNYRQYQTILADVGLNEVMRGFSSLEQLKLFYCHLNVASSWSPSSVSSTTTLRHFYLDECRWDVPPRPLLPPPPQQQPLQVDMEELLEESGSSWHTAKDGRDGENDKDHADDDDDDALAEAQSHLLKVLKDRETQQTQDDDEKMDDGRLSFLFTHALKCCPNLEKVRLERCGLESFSKHLLTCLPEFTLRELTLDITFFYSSSLSSSIMNTEAHATNLWSIVDLYPLLEQLGGSYAEDLQDEDELSRIKRRLADVAKNGPSESKKRNGQEAMATQGKPDTHWDKLFWDHPPWKGGSKRESCSGSNGEVTDDIGTTPKRMPFFLASMRKHEEREAMLEPLLSMAHETAARGATLVQPTVSFVRKNGVDPVVSFVTKNGFDPIFSFVGRSAQNLVGRAVGMAPAPWMGSVKYESLVRGADTISNAELLKREREALGRLLGGMGGGDVKEEN